MNIWLLIVGIAIGLGLYLVLARAITKFKIAPPAEPDPDDVVAVDQRYRCTVCGAEVVMTAANAEQEIEAPRHCREDMLPV